MSGFAHAGRRHPSEGRTPCRTEQEPAHKGKTGIKNWNVLCRWALCFSLHEGTVPTDVPLNLDSNVEMSWYTFAGEYSEIYEALIIEWCVEHDIEPTDENLSKYFKLHLERGIAYLSGTNFIKSMNDLLNLAIEA